MRRAGRLWPFALALTATVAPAEAPRTSAVPLPRPEAHAAPAVPPRPDAAALGEPGICGDPAILGRALAPIGDPARGCAVAAPVQVTSVAGVALGPAATMDCPTARALRDWVDDGLRPAFRDRQPVGLSIAAGYVCRSRNNRPGAPVSEHGRGKAIDIAAITFADGGTVTLADAWGGALRQAYRAACGIFGTTLGPGSDGLHEGHMHLDTADRDGRPYCR